MCTVSVIVAGVPGSNAGGFRIVCNRDESRERSPALPPHWRTLDAARASRAIWPIDADAGGTWIGASDTGLVLSLLNFNPCASVGPTAPCAAARGLVSRGLIIPEIIGAGSAAASLDALRRLDLSDFAPFRLVAIESVPAPGVADSLSLPRAIEARWDRGTLTTTVHPAGASCFTSSGLGDHLVQPRLSLFDQMVRPDPTRQTQDRFHRHQWPDRPEVSVMMTREDARTVSVTTVEVARAAGGRVVVDMTYREAGDLTGHLTGNRTGNRTGDRNGGTHIASAASWLALRSPDQRP